MGRKGNKHQRPQGSQHPEYHQSITQLHWTGHVIQMFNSHVTRETSGAGWSMKAQHREKWTSIVIQKQKAFVAKMASYPTTMTTTHNSNDCGQMILDQGSVCVRLTSWSVGESVALHGRRGPIPTQRQREEPCLVQT